MAAAALLCVLGPAPASASPSRAGETPEAGGGWFAVDYLRWSGKGDSLPALVTTSPPGTPQAQAGVLSSPATSTLYGDDDGEDGWASGARVRFGLRPGSARGTSLEGSAFRLGEQTAGFAAGSGGNPILARPFLNAAIGQQDALLVAYPGLSSGRIAIRETSRPQGADLALRREICADCPGGRVDGLIGYRFLRLADKLSIATSQLALALPLAGFAFDASDRFDTTNRFHGLDLGLAGDAARGPWTLTWRAKVAVGATFSKTRIRGQTTVTPPLGPASTVAGGLLAQPSNIGTHRDNRVALAPELSASLSYRLGPKARVLAGYDFTCLSRVVRPGDAIDTAVNPNQPAGPARPRATSATSDYWLQGVSIGLAFDF